MISINEMITALQSLKADVYEVSSVIQREQVYINETVNKVHANFSDQREGTDLIIGLHNARNDLMLADSAMYRVSQGLDETVNLLKQ